LRFSACLLWAKSGHVRCSTRCPLVADFVAKVVCDFGEQ
jgi:hypothetical protein